MTRQKLVDLFAQQLVARVAGDALAGPVDRREMPGHVVRVDDVVGVVEQIAVPLLALDEGFLARRMRKSALMCAISSSGSTGLVRYASAPPSSP